MKRLLFISHRVPYPPDKGERVRAFHQIRTLCRHYRVTLGSLARSESEVLAASEMENWCESVIVPTDRRLIALGRAAWSLFKGRSATEGYFDSHGLRRALLAEARREPFDLVLAYSSAVVPLALNIPARAHLADLVDVDSAKWVAYAARSGRFLRWLYRREAQGVAALENKALTHCEAVMLVSSAEAALLGGSDNVYAVGNGVDIEYFQPRGQPRQPPSLVFTGTMSYRPNAEAVCWFVREIFPLLTERLPALRLTIVGRDPTRQVQQLAAIRGVKVTGAVDDVRPYLSAAHLAVAPLRIARGVQNKILEAMAMGKAVVASPAAAEGLEVQNGRELLLADQPTQWRDAILLLLSDQRLRERIENAARRCVEEHYTWEAQNQPLLALCDRLSEGQSMPPPRQAEFGTAK